MSSDITQFLLTALIVGPGIILAITLHEASHGFVAWKLGDDTAYQLGRVTFNPLPSSSFGDPKSVSHHPSADQRCEFRVAHRRRGVTPGSMPLAGCAPEIHPDRY